MIIFIKRFFSFIIKFFIITLILAFLTEFIIYFNTRQEQYLLQADWHVKHQKTNEILFIGNSRTWIQVDAKLITKNTQFKSYVLAQDGRNSKIL